MGNRRSLSNLPTKDLVRAEVLGSDFEHERNKGCCTSPEERLTYQLGEKWGLSVCAVHVQAIAQASQGI